MIKNFALNYLVLSQIIKNKHIYNEFKKNSTQSAYPWIKKLILCVLL